MMIPGIFILLLVIIIIIIIIIIFVLSQFVLSSSPRINQFPWERLGRVII